ncbi:hypothetical protein GCM10023177_09620 [Streptomyces violaceoruber]|nr:hypothetical protein JCM4020_65020 [Streptomyces coelicolor]
MDSAFVFLFALPGYPHRPDGDPRDDLDRAGLGIVKLLEGCRGQTYPDMEWELKAAFTAVAAAVSEVTGPAHGDHCSVFAELAADLAPVYRRCVPWANGVLYLRGLLMPGVSGNCWSIAEAVGLDRRYRLHHLLERARWEEDTARDVARS